MGDTPEDQQTKIEPKRSTGSQDGGPSSCTPTQIYSDNKLSAKTLIKHEIDESLDTKEEIVQDQHTKSELNEATGSRDAGPSSFTTNCISSGNNSGAKTLIKCEIEEPLDVKDEIVQDQHTKSESNKATGSRDAGSSSFTTNCISSGKNSGAKTLIKCVMDEPVDVKNEIVQDQHTKSESNKSSGSQDAGPSSCTNTCISSGNNSGAKILIKCVIDETLDVKNEIVQDQYTKSESNKATGSRDAGPSSFTTTYIPSGNNSGTKILIKCKTEEPLDVKDEIVQDQHTKSESNKSSGSQHAGPSSCKTTCISSDQYTRSESNKSTGSQDGGPSSCKATYIPSGNNSGTKTLIKCKTDEPLDGKEEIVQDQYTKSESNKSSGSQNAGPSSCKTTCISSDQHTRIESNKSTGSPDGGPSSYTTAYIPSGNNSGTKTLIKCKTDEPLDVKEEIVQDQHTKSEPNKSTGSQDAETSSGTTTCISSGNNSGTKPLIKCETDEPLDVKEVIVQDQHTKSEPNKSTGSQDAGTSSGKTTCISSGNNVGAKILIKCVIDQTLDVKDEIVQDQHTRSESNKSTGSQDGAPSSCKTTYIHSGNNSGTKTLLKCKTVEPLDVKEEILQDQHTRSESNKSRGSQDAGPGFCTTTFISSGNNSGAKTLVKCEIDEPLCIKKEVIEDPERHQQVEHSLPLRNNKLDERFLTTEIPCDNKSRAETLIKYEYEDTLEIKEEIIRDQENIEYQFCTINTREADIMTVHKPRNSKNEKPYESKGDPKKKYKCEKCARSYFVKTHFNRHIKFECCVMPQFSCQICGKKFKQKSDMNRHILCVHQKTKSKASKVRHNCNKCSRSYSSLRGLNNHKRTDHAAVKVQFICDYCGFQTKRKQYLSQHFTLRHFQKIHVSLTEPEKKYKCEKCARSYLLKSSLNRHKNFECGVMPQFSCEFCGKKLSGKGVVKKHILLVHQKTNSNAPQTRHDCDKCSRSYSLVNSLNKHKRAEHAAVKPQFICDFCGFQTKRKMSLSRHINLLHFQEAHLSAPEQKYKCEKCACSFIWKNAFNRHKKFLCGVMTLFSCEFCGKQFKKKSNVNRHIISVHQKKNSKFILDVA